MYIKFRDNNNTDHILQVTNISYSNKEGGTLALAGFTGAGITYWESSKQISPDEFEHIEESLVKEKYFDLTKYTIMDLYYADNNARTI